MTLPDEHDEPFCLVDGCSHLFAPGIKVCWSHAKAVGDCLAQVGALYSRLDAVPSMAGREMGSVGGGHLAFERSNSRMDVLVMRDGRSRAASEGDPDGNRGRGMFEVLHYWAAGVRATQGLAIATRQLPAVRVCGGAEGPVCAIWCNHDTCKAGTMRGKTHVPLTVATERKLLSDHLDWILAQGAAGQFCDDLRTIWVQVRGLVEGRPAKRTVQCPACGVPARWTDGAIGCGACGTTTQGLELLKKRQEQAA